MVKLEITFHSSQEKDIVEVEHYDPVDINNQRNDDTVLAILLGKNSYSRIDLKNIRVIEEESTDLEQNEQF